VTERTVSSRPRLRLSWCVVKQHSPACMPMCYENSQIYMYAVFVKNEIYVSTVVWVCRSRTTACNCDGSNGSSTTSSRICISNCSSGSGSGSGSGSSVVVVAVTAEEDSKLCRRNRWI
jgi:hypothetical protein